MNGEAVIMTKGDRNLGATYIKEWRRAAGMTLEALGAEIGMTHASLSRIEARKQPYSQGILEAIADVFGCKPSDLLSGPPPAIDEGPGTSVVSDDIPRQPRRPHHLKAWAQKRGLARPTDLARELDIDKSMVTRWFQGTTPSEESLSKLGALFGVEPEALFRDPEEEWVARFLRGRSADEIERIKQTLEVAFPRKTG
ncbi:helix-turn-helix domain-containing protein [Bosea sp. NBC_00550]|uniref:helix-turn-helix domain-containing protein n=1 Tax=Bosea sp. NBC_00550 TaxID=2969621 RepID=UPI00222ED198|nr:helix-turn-helix transcriptional regulator [Bosea sp. NBC_00550]UZF93187.1 transcriptional regulator [Bosea sp. NBC_00550]